MKKQNGWADLAWALDQIGKEHERPSRLKTGFPQIDEVIGGGLAPGLVVLGGTPGVGKSTFCLQLAENAAAAGIPVLYFSLEMPELWIAAKAVSRRLFQMGCPIPAAKLMGGNEGDQLDQEHRAQVEQVKRSENFQNLLENLHIWTSPLTASQIKDKAKQFTEEAKENGKKKPLVIVDYLQIVPSEQESRYKSDKEKNDEKVKHFTQIAYEDGFTVILISSLNRSSYTGPMQISAFKETGGIEYSADLLLGLQFRNHGKNANLTKERGKNPREVEISVLKNRYGSSGSSVPLDYYAANDCFLEKKVKAAKEADKPEAAQKKAEDKAGKKQLTRGGVLYTTVNNTKAAGEIRMGAFGPRYCEVMEKKGDREAARIQYELSECLTKLDCCVADAVYTIAIHLWEDGVPQEAAVLSPRELLKILTGDPRPTITRQKRQELRESIEHLQKVRLKFNCKEELEARGITETAPQELQEEYDGPFLNMEARKRDGGVWDGLEFCFQQNTLPVFLHAYGSEVNQQMIRLPSILLKVSDGRRNMHNTEDHICLKRFLARRLEIIRHEEGTEKAKHMRVISFREDGNLLRELRYSRSEELAKGSWEQKLGRLHEAVRNILDYYKRIKYISGYEERESGHAVVNSFIVTGKIRDPKELS